jgi:TIR domain/Effector-associated domain 2
MSSRRLQLYLCHAQTDKPAVRKLYQQLQNDGIEAWFDEENLLPGSEQALAVAAAIRETDVILICLSKAAVATPGYHNKELKLALDKADEQPEGKISLIPLRLDDCTIPFRLSHLVKLDLFEEGGYSRLLKTLRKIAEQRQLETAAATLLASPANFSPPITAVPAIPKVLSFGEKKALIERLLACPSLSNPASRETVIGSLPPQIANNIARSPQALTDISNLLTTCLNYPEGLAKLIEILDFFEQGSLPFQELHRYLNQM